MELPHFLFPTLISTYHFILSYGIISVLLLSNNLQILVITLLISISLRILFLVFQKCILTDHELQPSVPHLATAVIFPHSPNLSIRDRELFLINMGIILNVNKIVLLCFIRYYIPDSWKHLIGLN